VSKRRSLLVKRVTSKIFPLALWVVACLAAGFFTAFLTDSLVATAIAGVIAGSVARWAYDAVRRRRAEGLRGEASNSDGASDDSSRPHGD